MKIAFKILVTIYLILFCANAEAQTAPPKRFGGDFKIGMNWADMDVAGGNMYKKPKFGVLIGGNVNYKLWQGFELQSGFYVVKKGLKKSQQTSTTDPINAITEIVNKETWIDANYAQIPLNIGYEYFINNDFALNVHAGVYAAYGFKGKRKVEGNLTSIAGTEEAIIEDYTSGESDTFVVGSLKRFDYGLGLSVGAIYDMYTLTIGHDIGLANVSDKKSEDMKTRSTYIALGIRF